MNPFESQIWIIPQISTFVMKMEKEIKIEPSEELAYWTGIAQSDGWLYHEKRRERSSFEVGLRVGRRSLPMMLKFQRLSKTLFLRDAKITKVKYREAWDFAIGAKNLLHLFEKWDIRFGDPPKPPIWCLYEPRFFGSYLAGIIDGDGDIRIKRPKYPQCIIRIHSGRKQEDLSKAITELLRCSVYITPRRRIVEFKGRIIRGLCFDLEFCVSSKSSEFVRTYILPKMTLQHKSQKLSEFLSNN